MKKEDIINRLNPLIGEAVAIGEQNGREGNITKIEDMRKLTDKFVGFIDEYVEERNKQSCIVDKK